MREVGSVLGMTITYQPPAFRVLVMVMFCLSVSCMCMTWGCERNGCRVPKGMMSLWGPCAIIMLHIAGNACRMKLCLVQHCTHSGPVLLLILPISRRIHARCRHHLRNLTHTPMRSPPPCSGARLRFHPSNLPAGPSCPAPGSARPPYPTHRRRACG